MLQQNGSFEWQLRVSEIMCECEHVFVIFTHTSLLLFLIPNSLYDHFLYRTLALDDVREREK